MIPSTYHNQFAHFSSAKLVPGTITNRSNKSVRPSDVQHDALYEPASAICVIPVITHPILVGERCDDDDQHHQFNIIFMMMVWSYSHVSVLGFVMLFVVFLIAEKDAVEAEPIRS